MLTRKHRQLYNRIILTGRVLQTNSVSDDDDDDTAMPINCHASTKKYSWEAVLDHGEAARRHGFSREHIRVARHS